MKSLRFDFMGFFFMYIAIWIGGFLSPMLSSTIPVLGGSLIGPFISGLVIYLVFSLISGTKMTIWGAVLFSIAVYISVFVVSWISGTLGNLSGWILMLFEALILSLIYGFIAPKKEQAKVPIKL